MLLRALLVLLIVLNAGAAAWWLARDPVALPPVAQPPPGVARLQLVSERPVAPASPAIAAAVPSAAAATTPAGTAAPVAEACFSLGPYATREAAEAAVAKVQPLVRQVAVRTPVTQAPTRGWRVFLPAMPSLQEAEATAAKITAAGFNDLLVVREGPEARSIALGRYRNEAGARNRAQSLAAAGFAAQVEPLDGQSTDPLWLQVRADASVPPARAQSVAGAAQNRALDCASIR